MSSSPTGCGPEGFARVAAQPFAPVAVAGGPVEVEGAGLLAFARQVVASGASGLMFGRNVLQRDDVGGMLRALASVVHGG